MASWAERQPPSAGALGQPAWTPLWAPAAPVPVAELWAHVQLLAATLHGALGAFACGGGGWGIRCTCGAVAYSSAFDWAAPTPWYGVWEAGRQQCAEQEQQGRWREPRGVAERGAPAVPPPSSVSARSRGASSPRPKMALVPLANRFEVLTSHEDPDAPAEGALERGSHLEAPTGVGSPTSGGGAPPKTKASKAEAPQTQPDADGLRPEGEREPTQGL